MISCGSIVLVLIATVLENINNNCHALRLISPEVKEVKYLKRTISSTTISIFNNVCYLMTFERIRKITSKSIFGRT